MIHYIKIEWVNRMTRRERLMATMRGESVDRPAVCFYELNGIDQKPDDRDQFNIYSHPSWRPLLDLTREKTDLIMLRGVAFDSVTPDPIEEASTEQVRVENGRKTTIREIETSSGTLTTRTRRDSDVNTSWTTEHLLKNIDDVHAYLSLPEPDAVGNADPQAVIDTEAEIGDSGIVMINSPDPLCLAASLFDFGLYTVLAMTETLLFRRLLDRFARRLLPRTEAASMALPGRLWRIYGPEYASPPYLPPALFHEYVCVYVKPMIEAIQRHGGYARIHSHGRLQSILDHIEEMGPDGLDPIEPPPQGDVELRYVRERYGSSMVLFGNIEASEIENLSEHDFRERAHRSVDEGTSGEGRGFVLMPSSCPHGRKLSPLAIRNYETMIEAVET